MRIAVVMTCHNRRELTLRCLRRLHACSLPAGAVLHVVMVDDGSTDGTSEAVRESFPRTEIIRGDGNLYWARGMYVAYGRALATGFDAYLWLNDDTFLYPDALTRMFAVLKDKGPRCEAGVIVVGSTCSETTGQLTYGGERRSGYWVRKSTGVVPTDAPQRCDTMMGNCILIPRNVAALIGNVDRRFRHTMADIDYGLRATKRGVQLWVAPGFVGTCEPGSDANTYWDVSLPRIERLRKLVQPKGIPPASWLLLTSRHFGPLWPLYWLWPFAKIFLKLR